MSVRQERGTIVYNLTTINACGTHKDDDTKNVWLKVSEKIYTFLHLDPLISVFYRRRKNVCDPHLKSINAKSLLEFQQKHGRKQVSLFGIFKVKQNHLKQQKNLLEIKRHS